MSVCVHYSVLLWGGVGKREELDYARVSNLSTLGTQLC